MASYRANLGRRLDVEQCQVFRFEALKQHVVLNLSQRHRYLDGLIGKLKK